jgi:23S rRNA (guanosine2251-2'-O)-methyltransferase
MNNTTNFITVYGIHPLIEILKAKKRKIYELFIDKNAKKNLAEILEKIPTYTKVTYCDKKKLDFLTGTSDHQSIAALVSLFPYKKELFSSKNKNTLILAANKIQDTRNLGGLFRSAYCTNITHVIIEEKSATDITGSVLKSAAGLCEHLEIYKTKNLESDLITLKKEGFHIYIASANGKYIDQVTIQTPAVIVIGNEHEGVSKSICSLRTETISLRQKESTISYNASVAGGIVMYYIAAQLNKI